MKRWKMLTCSVVGAIVCSLILGYSSKDNEKFVVKTTECIDMLGSSEGSSGDDNYWDSTSVDDIKRSILKYVDDMIDLTNSKLQDFKLDNNEDKIRLYENEVKRLKVILNNVRLAQTKEELRKAIQVRHKSNM